MTTREDLIAAAEDALGGLIAHAQIRRFAAELAVDAVLQIATVEQLEALPVGTPLPDQPAPVAETVRCAEIAIVGILGALLALDAKDDGSAPMSAEEVEAATQRIKAAVEGTRSGPPAAESDPLDADTLEQPAYGARCTYRELGAGQCLDHQGHLGDHQPAQETRADA